jgi:phosphatidylglycerol:prolipoprotein diacylglycerol transferase
MRQVLIEFPGTPLRIYGFGLMLCLAFLAAIFLAAWRARREKLNPEWIFDLAVWILIGGVIGARGFYVIQYWGRRITSLAEIFQIWQGGIVFYGGVIGGLVAGLAYARLKKLPILPLLDAVAPSVALGLAIGRVGCLLNGCCYGDRCELPWAVAFPPGSPPWFHQVYRAEQNPDDPGIPRVDQATVAQVEAGRIPPRTPWSGRIHPTQLYSTIDGLILLGLLSAYYPLRRRDGEVAALLLITYPITRTLIEYLRGDEAEIFLGMTISQLVSFLLVFVGIAFWAWLRARPRSLWADAHRG